MGGTADVATTGGVLFDGDDRDLLRGADGPGGPRMVVVAIPTGDGRDRGVDDRRVDAVAPVPPRAWLDADRLSAMPGDLADDAHDAIYYGLATMARSGILRAGRFIYRMVAPNFVPVRIFRRSETGSYVRRRHLGRR